MFAKIEEYLIELLWLLGQQFHENIRLKSELLY